MFSRYVPIFLILTILGLSVLKLGTTLRGRGVRSILDPGEQRGLIKEYRLKTCTKPNPICAFLQVNAKGVNRIQLCSCPNDKLGRSSGCRLTWDSDDGHSITIGSDQYKFCGDAPKLITSNGRKIAYTGRLVHSIKGTNIVSYQNELHCYCSENHNYVLADRIWEEEMIIFTYTCAPLPTCRFRDICKVVTENGIDFFVDRKCQCPQGLSCPTVDNLGAKFHHTKLGRVDTLKCQR